MLGLSGAGADVLVDSLSDPEIVDRINRWVKDKTRDLIPSILGGGAGDARSRRRQRALLQGQVADVQFDPAQDANRAVPDDVRQVGRRAMMHSPVAKFRVPPGRALHCKPSSATPMTNFRLVVVTTKSAPATRRGLCAGGAAGSAARVLQTRNGEIGMPKLSLSSAGELLPPLDAIGPAGRASRTADALEGFSDEAAAASRAWCQKLELRRQRGGHRGGGRGTAVVTTRGLGTPTTMSR